MDNGRPAAPFPLSTKLPKLDRCEMQSMLVALSHFFSLAILAVAFTRGQLAACLMGMQMFGLGLHFTEHPPGFAVDEAIIDDIEQYLAP